VQLRPEDPFPGDDVAAAFGPVKPAGWVRVPRT
jgi:hypothetical protein